MMFNKALVLIAALSFSQSSFAGDDILDLLEGKSETKTEVLFQEQNELTMSVRKALGKVSAEQNIFLRFLDQSKYENALFQWGEAFAKTSFARTPSGRALYSFVLFKNGLEVNAVENLISIQEATKIMPSLTRLWSLMIPPEHKVWESVNVQWTPAWTKVLGPRVEIIVRSRQTYDPSNSKHIFDLLKKSKVGTAERSWLEWQMALGLALDGEIKKSVKVLSHMMKDKNSVISKDLLNMTAARLLYQQGYLDAAVNYYRKVSKSSEYWFVAQEESAWSYIRKGEPQNTLAVTQSLMPKEFRAQIGPETVFLRTLAQLKVCDYPAVIKGIKSFKKRFRTRATDMMAIQQNAETPAVKKLITALSQGRIKLLSLGSAANKLPNYVSRDEVLLGLVRKQVALTSEAKIAGDLYARSLAGGTAKVGFDSSIEYLNKDFMKRATIAKSATLNRIKTLAREEVANIKNILNKMQIVDAELIQQISQVNRVTAASNGKIDKKMGTTGSKDKYALTFPHDGELWFDEIDNYRVDVAKGCQARKKDI